MAAGRPTKYTPELGEKIAALIREGATRSSAVRSQGIHIDTFHAWLAKYPLFSEAVTRAESLMLVECAQYLKIAAKDDWKAALEMLKRRERLEWQEAQSVDLTSAGQPLRIVLDLGDSLPGTEADAPDSAEE